MPGRDPDAGRGLHDRARPIPQSLRPQTYVEIGVRWGNSLAIAGSGTRAIGIDPRPRIEVDLVSHPKLFPMPSDDFFESFDLLKELEGPRLALAFIDGLHVFEQVLRDFIHLERYADKRTIVLIHDCLPIARLAANREPMTQFWSGDVWKIIPCLKKYRPDLKIGIIPARPSGLGVVTNLDPKFDRFDRSAGRNHCRVPGTGTAL